MTIEDLKRVCDDAERWNALHSMDDSSGWKALEEVRNWEKDKIEVISLTNFNNFTHGFLDTSQINQVKFKVPKFYELK